MYRTRYLCTVQWYLWCIRPRSDARCVREPDCWVSSDMTDALRRTTSYSWTYSWSSSWSCSLNICVQDKDHDIFSPGSHSDGLSLPRNEYRRERCVLGIVQGQNHDSLGVVIGQIKTNSTPWGLSLRRSLLSLIISFLDSQASLVLTTTNTCNLNSASSLLLLDSLRLAWWPSTQF